MIGHSESWVEFRNVLWRDAEILSLSVDYDDVTLTLRESSGLMRHVICEGYIGYSTIGFWDEVIIERAELENQGDYLTSCLGSISKRLGSEPAPSGNQLRNLGSFIQLMIVLSDDCRIEIAMSKLCSHII